MTDIKYSTITFKFDEKQAERLKKYYALPWWKRLFKSPPKQGKE